MKFCFARYANSVHFDEHSLANNQYFMKNCWLVFSISCAVYKRPFV